MLDDPVEMTKSTPLIEVRRDFHSSSCESGHPSGPQRDIKSLCFFLKQSDFKSTHLQ
jgi:hypothetical protein